MIKQIVTLIVGVLIGIAMLTGTSGLLAAQESTPAADEPMMMDMATPGAMDADMTANMQQMMDQCTAMMEMMSMMMGGDMAGMMGDAGRQGMMGTPEAMPAP